MRAHMHARCIGLSFSLPLYDYVSLHAAAALVYMYMYRCTPSRVHSMRYVYYVWFTYASFLLVQIITDS